MFQTVIFKSVQQLKMIIDELNASGPKCPVLFNRLLFVGENQVDCAHIPMECNCPFVNLTCGHVQGNWRKESIEENQVCPVCRSKWNLVLLKIGTNTAFFVDCKPLSHCFDPCGHVASECTVR